jgi:hypothetical protein
MEGKITFDSPLHSQGIKETPAEAMKPFRSLNGVAGLAHSAVNPDGQDQSDPLAQSPNRTPKLQLSSPRGILSQREDAACAGRVV